MFSGSDWTKDCVAVYQNVKDLKCRYAVFRIDVGKSEKLLSECENADKDIEFSSSQKGAEVDEKTKAALQKLKLYLSEQASNEPRYVVFNFAFSTGDEIWSRPIFIVWSPPNPDIRFKMLYDTSKPGMLKHIFTELKLDFRYDDLSYFNLEQMVKDVKSKES